MKILKIRMVEAGKVREISQGGIEFKLGDECGTNWGGGRVKEFQVDRGLDSVVVRKTDKFMVPQQGQSGEREEFDALAIPMHSVRVLYLIDEPKDAIKK